MGLGNILLLTQATCYTITLILSVCTVVPMAVHVSKFDGHCLLYTTGTFDSDDGHFIARWASPFYCFFTLSVGGLMVAVSLIQLVRMSIFLYMGTDSYGIISVGGLMVANSLIQLVRMWIFLYMGTDIFIAALSLIQLVHMLIFLYMGTDRVTFGAYFTYGIIISVGGLVVISLIQLVRMSIFLYMGTDSSFLSAFLDSVVSVIVMLLVFTTSVLVSDGFRAWCRAITQRFPACEDASVTQISKPDHVDTVGFYMHVGTAQFGAWSSWVCWVLQAVLCTRKLCLYHERENLMISMARERRLLNASHESQAQTVDDTIPILD